MDDKWFNLRNQM